MGKKQPKKHAIFRLTHVDNLAGMLQRNKICAPNFTPDDGISYRVIHHQNIQEKRSNRPIPCGPRGVMHDYVPFYFGPLSPMLLLLKSGRVEGYDEGQEPLVYLVTFAEDIANANCGFAFSDGHGIMELTEYYEELSDLSKVDWSMVGERYWRKTLTDPDRMRRKQAEFLVHKYCPWPLIRRIGVISQSIKTQVEDIYEKSVNSHQPLVRVKPGWYY